MPTPQSPQLPSFDALPLDPTGPEGNAWGLFGDHDELGMLNLITPETVVAATREIQKGIRISLDLPLDFFQHSMMLGRQACRHEMKRVGGDLPMNDDIITINTQSSTQWDGFRHHGYVKSGSFFMGHTQEAFESTRVLGIDAWAQNGGLQTRGVLIDWAGWARKRDIPISFLEGSVIPLDHIKAIVSEQKIEIRSGDVLFIRSGFAGFLKTLSVEDQLNISQRSQPEYIGLESTKETLRWLWENRFSAVAGDMVGLETIGGPNTEYLLHQWLLAGWGMPIGELFDLEELAERCSQEGRYTFYLSSVPLKMPGGVASPPNAVAIL